MLRAGDELYRCPITASLLWSLRVLAFCCTNKGVWHARHLWATFIWSIQAQSRHWSFDLGKFTWAAYSFIKIQFAGQYLRWRVDFWTIRVSNTLRTHGCLFWLVFRAQMDLLLQTCSHVAQTASKWDPQRGRYVQSVAFNQGVPARAPPA